MLSKNEIKYIQSLCHKKQRQEEGLFIAEGPKLADELLKSHYRIRKIYAVEEWIQNRQLPVDAQTITDIELHKISAQPAPNQVLVVAEQPSPGKAPEFSQQISIVLDNIQDPGNLGTIIRTADWFGITQLIMSPDTVDIYNPKVIQATMGSFTRVLVWYQPLDVLLDTVTVPVFGAVLNGNPVHGQESITEGILVIGNEGKGISAPVLPFITHPLTIPGSGGAESLNAAVAAGIIISHIKRY